MMRLQSVFCSTVFPNRWVWARRSSRESISNKVVAENGVIQRGGMRKSVSLDLRERIDAAYDAPCS